MNSRPLPEEATLFRIKMDLNELEQLFEPDSIRKALQTWQRCITSNFLVRHLHNTFKMTHILTAALLEEQGLAHSVVTVIRRGCKQIEASVGDNKNTDVHSSAEGASGRLSEVE